MRSAGAKDDKKMDLPSWMSEDNDHLHHKETEPLLFGTGALKLQDETKKPKIQQQQYGTTPHNTREDDDDDDDDDEEMGKPNADFPVVKTVSKNDNNNNKEKENKDKASKDTKATEGNSKDEKKPVVAAAAATKKSPPPPSKRAAAAPTKPAAADRRQKQQKQPQTSGLPAAAARPHVPPQNPILWMFHFINGSAVVASLMLLTTQILPLFTNPNEQFTTAFSVLNLCLKFYIVLFCVLFVLVEVDLPIPFIRQSRMLQSYFSRGFLYSFLGLISTVEAYSDRVKSFLANDTPAQPITWASIFMTVSAWIMCAIGLIYMLMGMCCLQRVMKQMKQDEQEAWRKYRVALRDWKQRREIYSGHTD